MNTQNLLHKLVEKQSLTREEAYAVAKEMLAGTLSFADMAAILTALHEKGEAVEEIVGFIQAMREHMVVISGDFDAIDVCGTGGDGSGTFNISTVVAFVVTGAGVRVAKHGNRAASSKSGSADVLEALGVNIMLTADQAKEVLQNVGMVFLFAPIFHPAFKYVGPVRKTLGFRTIFNFIGPFANPAGVTRQLIGVPNVEIAEKLAVVASQLAYQRVLIVASEDGLDEVSIFGKTTGFEVKGSTIRKTTIDPALLSHPDQAKRVEGSVEKKIPRLIRQPADFARNDNLKLLQGGSAKENAQIIEDILNGEKGPRRDIVVVNSAYALVVAGKVKILEEGIQIAKKSIDSGAAKRVLEKLVKETNPPSRKAMAGKEI